MKILIIEDDSFKAKSIFDFLASVYSDAHIEIKTSYKAGIRALLKSSFDLLILDMSLPTFSEDDIAMPESSFDKFAGIMILNELKRKGKLLPTILFTMFDNFGSSQYSVALADIDNMLKQEFKDYYLGFAFFKFSDNNWVVDLKKILHDFNSNHRR